VPPTWPLSLLTIGYPLWWALGLTQVAFILVALPMAAQLQRRRAITVPPGFGVYALFVVWVIGSGVMLNEPLDGTLPPTGSGRFIAYALRVATYLALGVIMLYVINLSETELPRRRVVRMLGVLGVYTVIGGFLGLLAPHLRFTAPAAYLLPGSIGADPYVKEMMSVEFAQLHDILGGVAGPQPRPSAPFEYTHDWGENLVLLLIWLIVGSALMGRGLRRVGAIVLCCAAVVPVVWSLNRGVWIGIALAIAYVAVRLAMRGKAMAMFAVVGVGVIVVGLVAVTSLGSIIENRAEHGHSNAIRARLNTAAVEAAISSPVVGYGGHRTTRGSGKSIAIGRSAQCPTCGNFDIGSTGELSHLLVSHGFVGALLYNLFLLWPLWRFRRDSSAIGIGASTVLVLLLFFQFFYPALAPALCWGMISIALLVRNERAQAGRGEAGRGEAASSRGGRSEPPPGSPADRPVGAAGGRALVKAASPSAVAASPVPTVTAPTPNAASTAAPVSETAR
jgi:hypothetical protein